jgi:hypothetical protein
MERSVETCILVKLYLNIIWRIFCPKF